VFAVRIVWLLLRQGWSLFDRSLGTTPFGYWLPVIIACASFAVGCFRNRRNLMLHLRRTIWDGFVIAMMVWPFWYFLNAYQAARTFLNPTMAYHQIPPAPPREPPSSGSPHLVQIEAPQSGNFNVAHGLGCYPSAVAVQMTSLGFITLQSPKAYDATNVYLIASDSKLTAELLIWCQR
jgi:hypothetical protein